MRSSTSSKRRRLQLLREKRKREARTSMLAFLQHVWWMPQALVVGRHTREICAALDEAVEAFLHGESSYLDVEVPYRHGKSDLVSRAFPAYFLGRLADAQPDVIMTGYGDDLIAGFSKDVKRIMRSPEYQSLFPGIRPGRGSDSVHDWAVEGSAGRVTAKGLNSGLTGRGAALLTIDDYCKKRKEAESETYRRETWESFKDDAMTRLAPVHIVIVCATSWHVDDMRGRFRRHMKEEKDFPQFKGLSFPARNPDGSFLFEERMGAIWYRRQYATLGPYSAAALLDCSPQVRGGNLLKTDRVKVHRSLEGWPKVRHTRVWDLASSAKQRQSDDPDWTVGALGCITWQKNEAGTKVAHLWVKHATLMREEAPARDREIKATAAADGPTVPIYVEDFGAYKDTRTTLKRLLSGAARVIGLKLPGDKLVKATPLEAIFEAGNVHILEGDWNREWLKQHSEFTGTDGGPHDDAVDTSAMLYHAASKPQAYMAIPGMQ